MFFLCAAEGLVPEGIESPTVSLSYQSLESMELVCLLHNQLAYGVQYQVTWLMDGVNVSSVLLTDTESSASYAVTEESFSGQQTVSVFNFTRDV